MYLIHDCSSTYNRILSTACVDALGLGPKLRKNALARPPDNLSESATKPPTFFFEPINHGKFGVNTKRPS